MSASNSGRPADAPVNSWIGRIASPSMRDYLLLVRADRPVGTWLLMWPCWWSVGLAAANAPGANTHLLDWRILALFTLGAFVLRGAGCIVNDLADRNFDPLVERTAGRPVASGAVSIRRAFTFLALHGAAGLAILSQFNTPTILLGFASVPLIALYPFAKRFTYWPQLVLGITFNWGALMGWSAVTGELPEIPALLLYAGCIAWTMGYDTIYAHQDKEDDVKVGVKSSALILGEKTKLFLWSVYGFALMCIAAAGRQVGLSDYFYIGLVAVGLHFGWQIFRLDIDTPAKCLRIFKSNAGLGMIVFISILAGYSV